MDTSDSARAGDHPRYYVVALAHGLDVLAEFSDSRSELSLAEIGAAAGVTLPLAVRIAYTLVENRFLVRNPITKRYRLGPKSVSLGFATNTRLTLPQIAEPYLIALRDKTGATIKLGIPDGTSVDIICRYAPLRYANFGATRIGKMPMFLGSLGRSILAWEDEGLQTLQVATSRAAVWKPTPRTLDGDRLQRELEGTRNRGYAFNDQGINIDHRSVGAPIRSRSGEIVASVNLSLSAHVATVSDMHQRYATLVLQAAADIGEALPLEWTRRSSLPLRS